MKEAKLKKTILTVKYIKRIQEDPIDSMRQKLIQEDLDETVTSEAKSTSIKSFVNSNLKKVKNVYAGKSPHQALFDKYTDCSICLEPLQHLQKVKIMPLCKHIFHEKCCNLWLDYRFRCPNCNSTIIEDPSAAPVRQD